MDAGFAGDLEDSKSTNGESVYIIGRGTFVSVTWLCKRQTAVSHSSWEVDVISLDAALRMEGLPSLILWELIIDVFSKNHSPPVGAASIPSKRITTGFGPLSSLFRDLGDVDYVPRTIHKSSGKGRCIIFKDNDAVIKQCVKSRSPAM